MLEVCFSKAPDETLTDLLALFNVCVESNNFLMHREWASEANASLLIGCSELGCVTFNAMCLVLFLTTAAFQQLPLPMTFSFIMDKQSYRLMTFWFCLQMLLILGFRGMMLAIKTS